MSDNSRLPSGNFLSIDALWAWISSDDDGEGIIGGIVEGMGMVPLIGADRARVESYRPHAEDVAAATGRRVVLVRFTSREELEELP